MRRVAIAWLLFAVAKLATAQTDPEVTLVTLGPGDTYWERFGHNALLIDFGHRSLVYHFGLFDFREANFLLRFARGRMVYLAAAFEGSRELDHYQLGNRRLRLQTLDLDAEQTRRLVDHLEWHRTPPNDRYRYDYFEQNCSTKIRDAIDIALGGRLARQTEDLPALKGTYRDHAHRLAASAPWMYVATDLAMGPAVDQQISRWEELFLPMELADVVADARDASGDPIVVVDREEVIADPIPEPAAPPMWWPWYLLVGLALAGLILWAGLWVIRAWGLIAGVLGVALLLLWLGTDHEAAWRNANILLFPPTGLLLAIAARKPAAQTLALMHLIFFAAAAALAALGYQDLSNGLCLTLPLHLAAWQRLRSERSSTANLQHS